MDCETGRIIPAEELTALPLKERLRFIEMQLPPTPAQADRGRVGRNDPCPCGSGKKFKRCHWSGKPVAVA